VNTRYLSQQVKEHCFPDAVRPNPSLERTSTGMAPRSSLVHGPLRGATPVAAAQLKR